MIMQKKIQKALKNIPPQLIYINDLDKIKEIYNNLKKDNKDVFLDLRKADFRYEFGVYDEDKNMIMVTKQLLIKQN